MKSKKVRRILYAAVPVLWCGALYFGSDNSLGTVLAKSVTTMTQTITAYTTAYATQTAVSTQTLGQVPTVAETGTQITVPVQVTTVATVNEVEGNVPTQVEVEGSPGRYQDGVTQIKTQVTEYRVVETSTAVPTVTAVDTQAESVLTTMTLQQTMAPTQVLTMTETVTATNDAGDDDKKIEQVTPTTTPTTPTVTPTTAPAETPTVTPVYDGDPEEPKGWRPQTADEKERASYVPRNKITVKQKRLVSIEPAMQGPLCIAAMKNAMMKGGQIGYTYNIKYIADENAKQPVYEIDKPIQITFSIPKDILKEGRTYEMICVSKDGTTYTCPATVDEDGNLTFTTKYFYAYALTYKDA